jgi:hypothetical protein
MFDWFKKLFSSKDFDEYSKNEKPNYILPQPLSIPTLIQPTQQTTTPPPIVRGVSGISGPMNSGLIGQPGQKGQNGNPGWTHSSGSMGQNYYIVCEGCFIIFVPNQKANHCPSCTQKLREEKINQILEK